MRSILSNEQASSLRLQRQSDVETGVSILNRGHWESLGARITRSHDEELHL
ncbi:MAG TPA: hypothetical protein VH253_12940 [Phycisphaerae bacterium]|nr:hypothetical protein [Phycisphaerae bacterium]